MHYKQHNKYDPTQRERDEMGEKLRGGVGWWNTEKEKDIKKESNNVLCSDRTF